MPASSGDTLLLFRRLRRASRACTVFAIGAAIAAMLASAAQAGPLGVIPPGQPNGFSFDASTVQAGAHPDLITFFHIDPLPTFEEVTAQGSPLKDAIVDLPPGLVGNPEAVDKCTEAELRVGPGGDSAAACPATSQVGVMQVNSENTDVSFPLGTVGLYSMQTTSDRLALFGANVVGAGIHLSASVRPGDYGLRLTSSNIFQIFTVADVKVTVWGIPADPIHDDQRCGRLSNTIPAFCSPPVSVPVSRKPFLTNPTACDGLKTTTISVDSWWKPGDFNSASVGSPSPTECDKLDFKPSLDVNPEVTTPDSPTGLTASVALGQNDNPDGLGTAHLKDVTVTFPEGMTVSPSSADGLQGCSDSQLSLLSDAVADCPDASKIGTVTAETPVLDEPLTGSVYVGTQKSDDPESGELFRIFLELRGPGGLVVKLPGHVSANSQTGQLSTSFVNNPQLPVSRITLHLNGGPRAALATPPTCGTKTVTASFTSWAGHTESGSSSFTIDCPGVSGFSPSFSAGTLNPSGGTFSPFAARINRSDRQEYLDGVSLTLPPGVLARLKGVPLCLDAQANAGTCGIESRVGTATVGAGPGSNPYFLKGDVWLTGPYKGAPYGLSVAVRAVAGPYDLGTVVVRQAIFIDPDDAHVTVVSDPLPTILKGVPLRVRSINVDMDRPGFTLNPTSCDVKQIAGTFHSTAGSQSRQTSRFQVGDCAALSFKPKLALRLTGRKQTTDGKHPGLKAVLTQRAGQANIDQASVALPLSLALDPDNAQALCEFEAGKRVDCPKGSIIGRAKASTPLLNKPISGPIYFVKGIRIDRRTGRQIRTLPTLLIPLRGEVALNIRATSAVKKQKLVTTFATVPDAPVSRFELSLNGGRHGILAVTGRRNLCNGKQVAQLEMDGHNGKRADQSVAMRRPCGRRSGKKR